MHLPLVLMQDHGNCSVGSVTHGLKTLSEVANNSDVSTLLECGWVSKDMVVELPVVKKRPEFITYGPLEDTSPYDLPEDAKTEKQFDESEV